MRAFHSGWTLLKVYPVIETEDGDYQCGKCSTFHESFLDAEECCSKPLLCGYRQHGMDESAQECCPMDNPPTRDVGPLSEEGQDVLALMRFRELFGEPDEESSDYFKRSWDVLKMPFVPGSIRVEGVDEADDEYEERTRYEADFFDPVDNKTRRMRLHPLPRRKPRPEGAPRPYFGGGPPQEGIITSIELPDEDLREPEAMFGRKQQEPFAFFEDWHSGLKGDRLFVPSHLRGRERGIADALFDATVELRQNLGRDARITPDLVQTKDAIRFFHDRTGNFPKAVFPLKQGLTVGDNDYYRADYGSYRIGGEHPNDPPEWNSRTNRGKVSFDDAWQQMFTVGQLEMQKEEETARYYERAYNCTICGGSETPDCEHALGHPWFEEYNFVEEMHPNTRKEHEQMKSLYPATWALHEMREAER